MSLEKELKRVYINNVERVIKREFTEYAKKKKVSQAFVFEEMWNLYKLKLATEKETIVNTLKQKASLTL